MKLKRIDPTSRLTGKFQATVPKAIREKLNLKAGDTLSFHVQGEEVILRRVTPLDLAYLESLETTLSEWNSENDDDAYNDL